MKGPDAPTRAGTAWENEIRMLEQKAVEAFLRADLATLDELWADNFAVNSPLQKVLTKQQVMGALQSGRIRHLAYEGEIEYLSRRGDLVVVMGRDRVVDPPDATVSHRRFTNIWQYEDGVWRSVARHAHVVSREPGTPVA